MFFGQFASIEVLVEKNHTYRKIKDLVDINQLLPKVKGLYSAGKGRKGYGAEKALRMLIMQFIEDLRACSRLISDMIISAYNNFEEMPKCTNHIQAILVEKNLKRLNHC